MRDADHQQAIDRWKANARAERLDDISIGLTGCSFCQKYHRGGSFVACSRKCPIKAKTGEDACKGTPYPDVIEAIRNYDLREARRHSQRMVEFLEGL